MSLMLEVFQKDSLTGDYGVQAENSRHFIFRLAKNRPISVCIKYQSWMPVYQNLWHDIVPCFNINAFN